MIIIMCDQQLWNRQNKINLNFAPLKISPIISSRSTTPALRFLAMVCLILWNSASNCRSQGQTLHFLVKNSGNATHKCGPPTGVLVRFIRCGQNAGVVEHTLRKGQRAIDRHFRRYDSRRCFVPRRQMRICHTYKLNHNDAMRLLLRVILRDATYLSIVRRCWCR